MKNTIFIYSNNISDAIVAEVNESLKVGMLIKKFVPELSKQKDFLEDVEIYKENEKDDLDKGITISEAGINHGDHIFVGRCKKVPVIISYAGKKYSTEVSPSTNMSKLKKKAIKNLEIDNISGAALMLWHNNTPLDQRLLVGSLTDYPAKTVELILASKNDVNGDPSQDLFLHHTKSSAFLSGEIEGRWGIISETDKAKWPVCYIWIIAKSGEKYTFKFDLDKYPKLAPTAEIWDMDTDRALNRTQRPSYNSRCIQIFKNWGKPCNYLPCDREALVGHSSWRNTHPHLIWDPNNDSIYKYVNELYETLNT